MDLACSTPACRGAKLTTTALIHSSSPPGFRANQKELSTRGKVKAHNGCVVTENDKIILLKRVYTSPVRRSTRVRRKGCLVVSTPLPKRRHSVSAHTVTVNSLQTAPLCCPKSAEPALLNSVNGETPETPDATSLLNLTSPATPVKEGFQWSEETPRRRLSVRITETAEIRRKLAEAGMPRLSLCADLDATTPGQYPVLQNCLSQDDNYAPPCGFGNDPLEPIGQEDELELSKCDTKSMFDPSTYLGSVFPDLQCTTSSFGSDEADFGSTHVVGGESLSSSKTSLKSKRVDSVEFMNGFSHASSESEMESVDSSDELSRDAGDEVLCISPLPFENSETNFSFTPIQTVQSRRLHLELPKCLLSEHDEQSTGLCDVEEFLSSSGSSPVSSMSAEATVNSSLSSRSPGSILRVDLGRNNPLSPLASPTGGNQSKCRDVEYPSPRKNGLRPVGLLKLMTPSPTSTLTLTDSSNINSLEFPDPLTDDVCIVNLTPNNRVYNSLKDKEPSPTYASQANTESPSSPRNTSIEQMKSKQNTPDALSTELDSKRNSPLVQLKSPTCLSPAVCLKEDTDFQDFSEFDFLASDESALLAQATRQSEVVTKPVSPEKVLNHSLHHLLRSPDGGSHLQCHSDQHRNVQLSKESMEVSSLPHEVQVFENHQQIVSENYPAAHHKPSESNSINVKESDEVWTSASDFLLNHLESPSRKKKTCPRRSSMRIAKRMSLLTADVEAEKGEAKDSGKIMQVKNTETSKMEAVIVVKRKRGRPKNFFTKTQISTNHCSGVQNIANPIPSTLNMETQSTVVTSNHVSTDITLPVPDAEEEVERKRGRPRKYFPKIQINPNPCPGEQNITYMCVSTDITLPVPEREEQLKLQFDDDPKPNLVKRSRRRCSARFHQDLAVGDSCCNTSDLPADDEVKRNEEKDAMLHLASSMTLINTCYTVDDESAITQLNTHDREVIQELPVLPSGRASNVKPVGKAKRRRSIRLLTAALNQEEDAGSASGQISQEDEAKAPNLHISPTRDVENLMNNLETDAAVHQCKHQTQDVENLINNLEIDAAVQSIHPAQNVENPIDNLETYTAAQSNLDVCNETGEAGLCSENVDIEIEENEIYFSTHFSHSQETFTSSPNNGLVDNNSRPFYANLAASSALDKASSNNQPEENATSRRPKRRRSGVTLSAVQKREVKCKKRCQKSNEEAVKELYLKRGESKALKQSNLETIFEEVHFGKRGSPVYAGSRKCKRSLTFLEHPWLPRKRKKHQKDKISQVKRKKKSLKDPNIDKKLEALLADLTLSPSQPFTPLW
ncbi:uncharacterized protein LOC117290081 [Asterias rubens]|uniref:uncharacterized protein LOC117290081 n=1 Tax=Asterias rubens TaxID=7604 RepID=UPI001455689A|nr:uncharacterized protein LOC117290081 [Asterias rubens]